ncbi:MAG TPA: NAD-dependent epimerase/dehydratase family protein [Longimicrobiales bacterium]|nr:NAD-dependent epimerase/dehydratase family protein [Longimicrobiales bacterium]
MTRGSTRRVLVTGVAGFIGSNLATRLLADGIAVVGLDDLSQGVVEQVPSGVELHRLDVRSPAIYPLFDGVDAVFHLAARNCISDCQLDPVAAASINVVGTVNVFEAARVASVRRVIHAESSALYEGIAQIPTTEDRVAPLSMYAITKLAGAAFGAAYARFHDMQMTALRYFCVYGPRQDYRRTIPPVMSAFIIKLLRGERPTIYGTGEKRRDFVYVDDVNDFHMQCLTDARTVGGTYNLGSGTDHSVREILAEIQALLGTALEPLHRPDLPGEAERTCADIARARSVGWQPRTSLREGLRHSIAYIREHVVAGEPELMA